jgi:hypothetical protein
VQVTLQPHPDRRHRAVVGSVITLVNQGDVLVAGDATTGTAVKIGINFLIPFVSSNLGVLAYVRTAAAR